jgi:hypothetical protein
MYSGLCESACYSFQIVIKPEFSRQLFEKYSDIKFHENPSIGSRVDPCGRTDRLTVTTRLKVTFRNFLDRFSKIIIEFGENPSSVSRVVPCRRTDRYDEADSRFSQFSRRIFEK